MPVAIQGKPTDEVLCVLGREPSELDAFLQEHIEKIR